MRSPNIQTGKYLFSQSVVVPVFGWELRRLQAGRKDIFYYREKDSIAMKILCKINFHKWITVFRDNPRVVQQCTNCKKHRSTMYDMTYGSTYWVSGNHWM